MCIARIASYKALGMPNSTRVGYIVTLSGAVLFIREMHFSLYTRWLVHICVSSLLMVLILSETNQDFILVLQPFELAATLNRGSG